MLERETIFKRVLGEIDNGTKGLNKGINFPFERLKEYIPNIQKKTYTLIGAGAKVGKTSFADDVFLYNVYDEFLKPDSDFIPEWHYFSFEIDAVSKIIKGVVRKLYYKYGIYTDVNYVLSKGKNRVSQEIYDKVLECRDYFEKLEDYLHIYETPTNPTGVYKQLMKAVKENGSIIYRDIEITENNEKKVIKKFDYYKENNQKRYVFPIVDHISLTPTEKGLGSTKSAIDKVSQDMVTFRNNFFMSPVIIQQLIFNVDSPERYSQKRLRPQLSDFSDSKYTTRDADLVYALFNPSDFRLTEDLGYDIRALKQNYRSGEILRDRNGSASILTGFLYLNKIGSFQELPKPEDVEGLKKIYEKIK